MRDSKIKETDQRDLSKMCCLSEWKDFFHVNNHRKKKKEKFTVAINSSIRARQSLHSSAKAVLISDTPHLTWYRISIVVI